MAGGELMLWRTLAAALAGLLGIVVLPQTVDDDPSSPQQHVPCLLARPVVKLALEELPGPTSADVVVPKDDVDALIAALQQCGYHL